MGVIKNLLKSILIRPFKLWNIENRAHKALDKQQIRSTPVTAPKHPSTANKIEEFNRGKNLYHWHCMMHLCIAIGIGLYPDISLLRFKLLERKVK
jgi:hypothetical protein